MAVGDVTTILKTIMSIGSEIRLLIDTGYKVSEKLKGFEQKLERLGRDQKHWEDQIVKFGLSWDQHLLVVVGNAKSRLEHEKKSLSKKVSSKWWIKSKRALVPSQVEETIIRVEKIFDDVLDELDGRDNTTEALQKRALARAPLLSFKEDNRYVRLDNTNKRVIRALGKADGPPIVLLHGFSGTGKSSLARDVALQLQEAINRRHHQNVGPSQSSEIVGVSNLSIASDSSTELWPAGSLLFEQVIFLECGPRVDLQAKQKELKDALGWNVVPQEGNEAESDKKLVTALAGLLKEKPLLIILDDVWKSTVDTPEGQGRKSQFLQKLTDLGGKSVKWLVTSQEGDLCSALNVKFEAIPMEHIKLEVAKQILSRQIGFRVDEMREPAMMYMDKIIQKVDANPLAMTCISPAIDRTRFDDEQDWEVAMQDVANLLDTRAETPIHSKEYGLSFWGAIKVGFDLLTKQHQNLLVLMAFCKGPSVPEEIIQYLFVQSTDTHSYHNFSSSRMALEGRQLITISVFKPRTGKEGKRWTLHDMIKEFIMKEYFSPKDAKTSLSQRLSNQGIMFRTDSALGLEFEAVTTLIALYFDEKFRNELGQFSSLKVDNPDFKWRGKVIEHISRMLVLRENDKWTSTLHLSTRQGFISFMRDGQFNEDSTLNLLNSYQYALPMIGALNDVPASFRMNCIFGKKVMCALARLFENATALNVSKEQRLDYDLFRGICLAVHWLVRFNKVEHRFSEGISFSKAFAQIANLLTNTTNDDHSGRQQQLARGIADLAQSHKDIGLELANVPGILEGLVKASLQVDNRDLQAAAVGALTEFARLDESVQLQIINVPGMLDGLVKALTANDHDQLQLGASRLLCQLSQNAHIALKIMKRPDAFSEIVNTLGKGSEDCAQALEHLAFHDGSVKVRLLPFSEGLVKDFFNDHNHDLQARALAILAMLAKRNLVFRLQMVDVPGMLDKLVKALTADNQCHELQNHALVLLIALSSNDRAALKIVEFPGALGELVHGLGKDTNEKYQKRCARALRLLASLGDSMRYRLIQFPNLIKQLVGALMSEGVDKYPSKVYAGYALLWLAIGNHHIKSEMRNFPDLLETLIDAIRKDDNEGLAIYLLTALSPQRGKEIHLNSEVSYARRGEAEAHLGLYKAALEDLDEACRLGESVTSLRLPGNACAQNVNRLHSFKADSTAPSFSLGLNDEDVHGLAPVSPEGLEIPFLLRYNDDLVSNFDLDHIFDSLDRRETTEAIPLLSEGALTSEGSPSVDSKDGFLPRDAAFQKAIEAGGSNPSINVDKWALNRLFKFREFIKSDASVQLTEMEPLAASVLLCEFFERARKENGELYPPPSLMSLLRAFNRVFRKAQEVRVIRTGVNKPAFRMKESPMF